MKTILYTLLMTLFALPSLAAAQSIPSFPMAFWGNVTINGNPAPVGTIVRAYYGATLAGTVTVQDAGVYGYTAATRQKLVLGDGTGTISFTVQSSSYNGGVETPGTASITYPQFTSGKTVNLDLSFTVPTPIVSSGGGGGGGGGGPITAPTPSSGGGGGGGVVPAAVTVSTTTATTSVSVAIATTSAPVSGVVLGAQTYNFSRNLTVGSTGNDVVELQKVLIADGYLKLTQPTTYFGSLTKAAVRLFQNAHGIVPASGYVGPLTRAVLNRGSVSDSSAQDSTAGNALSAAQRTALLEKLKAQLSALLAEIVALTSQSATSSTAR